MACIASCVWQPASSSMQLLSGDGGDAWSMPEGANTRNLLFSRSFGKKWLDNIGRTRLIRTTIKSSIFARINCFQVNKSGNANANPCFMSPRTTSGQAIFDLMRQSQVESEQFWSLLRVEENLKEKTTRHWLWRVKDIQGAAHRSNPGYSS